MKTIVLSICALGAATCGVFAQASKVESTTAVIPDEPAKTSPEVGLSARDGITISGTDLMMTRNGVTEKVTKALELENGTRVQPNGTITTAEGAKIVLRPSQILMFDGRLLNISTTTAPASTTTTTTTSAPAAPVTPVAPVTEKATPDAAAAAAAEAARAEAERRARAAEAK